MLYYLTDKQKNLLRSVVPGLRKGIISEEWVLLISGSGIMDIAGLNDLNLWMSTWCQATLADFAVFVKHEFFLQIAQDRYILVAQRIFDAVESNFGVAGTAVQKQHRSNKVFVVHGHDSEMQLAVARTLEQLELEPVILHEKANRGRTVIEKFEHHADVSFAVVLLSPDDMGYSRQTLPDKARPRARQNVVLELGYFMGKLGRANVLSLYRDISNFELPSDFSGILYTPYDGPNGTWRMRLAKELGEVGFNVDFSRLS
jgi:predicted nucleotide-binding protein